jgi:hypothetical protein
MGKREEKRQLGRPSRRWKNNITMDLKSDEKEQTGLIWLRIRLTGRLL